MGPAGCFPVAALLFVVLDCDDEPLLPEHAARPTNTAQTTIAPVRADTLETRVGLVFVITAPAALVRSLDRRAVASARPSPLGEAGYAQIAAEAQISVRTFYRYFPSKEDVLQHRIDQRTESLRVALAVRPIDEAPLQALRLAVREAMSADDMTLLRRWTAVIAATPNLLQGVLGGIHLKSHAVIAEFFGARMGLPSDAFVPTIVAAAVGGVMQAVQTQWYFRGGDLASAICDGLEVLERGIGTDTG